MALGSMGLLRSCAVIALVALPAIEAPVLPRAAAGARGATSAARIACEGRRPALPDAILYTLRAGAFPGSGHADVAVHVPPGFDATRRPGVVVYFHGWQGCVAAALAADDAPCSDAGTPRGAANLSRQIDEAYINALLVAIEVRVDAPTGEPGRLAMPAGLRDLLREVFVEHLSGSLGCTLDVDALDRVVLIAHSGGYQAAAGALMLGDVPRVTEVALLDALYGADEVFSGWVEGEVGRFDARLEDALRFVDLYTCCGGTAEASRALARRSADALSKAGLAGALYDDDGEGDVNPTALAHPVLFKRVPRQHADLPGAYVRQLVEAAGFARIGDVRPIEGR
jgi:hypothetical protein